MLPEFLDPSRIAIDLFNVMPTQAVYLFTLSRIFQPCNAKAFWPVSLVSTALWAPIRTLVPAPMLLVGGLFFMIGLPGLLLRGALFPKAIILTIGTIFMLCADVPSALLWSALTGNAVMDYDAVLNDFPAHVVVTVFHLIVFVLLMSILFVVSEKVSLLHSAKDEVPCDAWERGSSLPASFLWFPVIQLFLVQITLTFALAGIKGDAFFYGSLLFPLIFSMTADGYLLFGAQRYFDKRLIDMRAEALEQQATEYLASAVGVQEQLKDAARLRHDLRNHLQVVEGLCERGETASAKAYLDEAAQMLKGS